MTLEGDFHADMLRLCREAKQEGYTPSYFLRTVNEMGGLAAAKKLINDDRPSEGFTRLWEMGRLDLTSSRSRSSRATASCSALRSCGGRGNG